MYFSKAGKLIAARRAISKPKNVDINETLLDLTLNACSFVHMFIEFLSSCDREIFEEIKAQKNNTKKQQQKTTVITGLHQTSLCDGWKGGEGGDGSRGWWRGARDQYQCWNKCYNRF